MQIADHKIEVESMLQWQPFRIPQSPAGLLPVHINASCCAAVDVSKPFRHQACFWMAAEQPIKTLFVTLRRSFAGTRESHIAVLRSLGLSYREQTVQVPNRASVRGAIDKVQQTFVTRKVDTACTIKEPNLCAK